MRSTINKKLFVSDWKDVTDSAASAWWSIIKENVCFEEKNNVDRLVRQLRFK